MEKNQITESMFDDLNESQRESIDNRGQIRETVFENLPDFKESIIPHSNLDIINETRESIYSQRMFNTVQSSKVGENYQGNYVNNKKEGFGKLEVKGEYIY